MARTDTPISGEVAAIRTRSAGISRGYRGGGGRRLMRPSTGERSRTREERIRRRTPMVRRTRRPTGQAGSP